MSTTFCPTKTKTGKSLHLSISGNFKSKDQRHYTHTSIRELPLIKTSTSNWQILLIDFVEYLFGSSKLVPQPVLVDKQPPMNHPYPDKPNSNRID